MNEGKHFSQVLAGRFAASHATLDRSHAPCGTAMLT
jgi:hypothetical protein